MSMEIKDKATQRNIDALVSKLRRRQVIGSRQTALETVLLLRQVVASAKFNSIEQLLGMVKGVGKRLIEAQPKENSVGNIVRKVLKLIREEYVAAAAAAGLSGNSTPQQPSRSQPLMLDRTNSALMSSVANFVLLGHPRLHNSVASPLEQSGSNTPTTPFERLPATAQIDDFSKKVSSIKPALIDAIQEVIDELETVYENIAKNARDHIHSDEIVLTIGHSRTVEAFLKSAARDRKFTVIVAETAPSYSGRVMADTLSSAGISTILVPDSCLYALMSRVNKVILGAHAIMANGGTFAIAGSLLAASAARAHSTPVVICTGQFKLTPLWSLHHQYDTADLSDPEQVLSDAAGELPADVDVVNPYFDYVKPELVDVFITNYGDHPPAYVYRLVKETYDDEDTEI